MAKRSNNAYYRSPDITGIINNLQTAMGLKGNADSNYLTDLNKMGRLEGITFDNRRKSDIERELENVLSNQELSATDRLGHTLLGKRHGYELGESTSQKRASEVLKAQRLAALTGNQLNQSNDMRALFAKMMQQGGNLPPQRREDQYGLSGREGRRGAEVAEGDALTKQNFAETARLWLLANKIQPGSTLDVTGDLGKKIFGLSERETESKIAEGTARIDFTRVKIEGYKDLNAKEVNRVLKATDKIISDMRINKDIGHENVNKIRQGVLDKVNESQARQLNLAEQNKLIRDYILTEAQRLKTQTATAGIKELQLEAEKPRLAMLYETLRQKKRKAAELARIAEVDAKAAQQLKTLEIEIAELDKAIRTEQKGKAELQKDTAEAVKGRAITLAEMSVMEKEALGPEILAKATKLEGEIRKDEATIQKIQAQTQTEGATRQLRITQNRVAHNKDIIQKLLAPYVRDFAKQRASNEAGEFAKKTSDIILKDKLKNVDHKATTTLDPDTSLFDPSTWFNSLGDVNKEEYADISASMFEHKDKIKSGTLPAAAINTIIADIMRSLKVDAKKAKDIYEYTISTFPE
jgi:hypothetical protein